SNFNLENKNADNMMLGMTNLNKVILGPNTRLNHYINWEDTIDGVPHKWRNIDKPDVRLSLPSQITDTYNSDSSSLSGTWILIGVKSVIGVHDSNIYLETPSNVKNAKDWKPSDNFDYAYDIYGGPIGMSDEGRPGGMSGIEVTFPGTFNPSRPGKYQVIYTIREDGTSKTVT
ncbi:TPA: hypothetical protein ACJHMO_003684, partial [Enterococcus faecalis]